MNSALHSCTTTKTQAKVRFSGCKTSQGLDPDLPAWEDQVRVTPMRFALLNNTAARA